MNELLQKGIQDFRAGKHDEARKLFIDAIKQDPNSEQAWGWLYNVAKTDQERQECLWQILRINPKNEKVSELLDALSAKVAPSPVPETNNAAEPSFTPQLSAISEKEAETLADEKNVIRYQYMIYIGGTALLILAIFMTPGIPILFPLMPFVFAAIILYVGLSSLIYRVSIFKLGFTKRMSGFNLLSNWRDGIYYKGKDATNTGIILLVLSVTSAIVDSAIFMRELVSNRWLVNGVMALSPNGYTTVFSVAQNSRSLLMLLVQFLQWLFIVLVGIAVIALIFIGISSWARKRTFPNYGKLLIIFIFISVNTIVIMNINTPSDCTALLKMYDSQQYEIAEGIVSVSNIQPAGGHAAGDRVQIGKYAFTFSYYVSSCAYHTTITHGGVLTEGAHARVYYNDRGQILQIDLKK